MNEEKKIDNSQTANDGNGVLSCVSGMSLDELYSELSTQEILYSTEKDINKANRANWRMTVLLNEICKRNGLNDCR
jgi:hypothetical protein